MCPMQCHHKPGAVSREYLDKHIEPKLRLHDCLQIPRVEARLSTFLTRFEAQQQLAEAKGILEGHQKAHQELKGSPCMAAALQLTLAMGNFLNWGTRLGQGAGFRLRNLPKLQVCTGYFSFLFNHCKLCSET